MENRTVHEELQTRIWQLWQQNPSLLNASVRTACHCATEGCEQSTFRASYCKACAVKRLADFAEKHAKPGKAASLKKAAENYGELVAQLRQIELNLTDHLEDGNLD